MNGQNQGRANTPTGVFDIEKAATQSTAQGANAKTRLNEAVYAGPNTMEQLTADFAVGNVRRNVTEKTLKKRMARFVTSKQFFALACLTSLSALLTCFRGYLLPFTLFLVLERVAMAATLWTMFFTAGKKGKEVLPWLSVAETALATIILGFIVAFVGAGMFSKQLLFSGQEKWVELIYRAGMWAVIPALLCIATAYCIFLFKQYERLLCCNVRDALRYGFPYEKGSYKFFVNCIIVAVAMPALYILRGVLGDFSAFDFLSDGALKLFNAALPKGNLYWLNLVGILVHSATMALAGTMAVKYSGIIKRYKQQRDALRRQEAADRAGVEELRRMEEEKTAQRQAGTRVITAEMSSAPLEDSPKPITAEIPGEKKLF